MVDSQYFLPNDVGISPLDCREAFQLLSPSEQLYAHYISRASWYGGLAVLLQTSPESPAVYVLLQRLFRAQPPSELQSLATSLTDEEYQVRETQGAPGEHSWSTARVPEHSQSIASVPEHSRSTARVPEHSRSTAGGSRMLMEHCRGYRT